jgi:hypothetical protein
MVASSPVGLRLSTNHAASEEAMTELGKVCEHSQLQRQCPLCERDATIAELRAALANLVEAAQDSLSFHYRSEREICENALRAAVAEARKVLT